MHLLTATESLHVAGITLEKDEHYLVEDITAGEMLARGLGTARHEPQGERIALDLDWNGVSLLLVRPGGFGDLLFLTPILAELQRRWPQIKLGVCCFRRYMAALRDFPEVELLPYPLDVRVRNGYDAVAWMEGAIEREPLAHEQHIVDALALRLPMPLPGFNDYTLRYSVTAAEATAALNRFPRQPRVPRIGVQLSASVPVRTYPYEQMSLLLRLLWQTGAEVLLFGAPGELRERTPDARILNLTAADPALSMAESVALLETCDVVVAPDSAMTHFAAALRVPCVALYGSFPWQVRTAPYATTRALTGQAPCAPCFHHPKVGAAWPKNGPCNETGYCVALAAIEPERVVRAVVKLLDERPKTFPVPAHPSPTTGDANASTSSAPPLLGENQTEKPNSAGAGE